MTKRLLIFAVTFCSASALYGQCTASASGSTTAAAEINARMCSTETFIVGAGGVTANTLVVTDTSSPAKMISATGSGAYGVALSTAIAGASVQVQRYGEVSLVMENAATAGHLVIPGTSNVMEGRDSGQTSSSAIGVSTRIVGVLLTSASAGATATIELSSAHFGTLVLPSGTGVVNVASGTGGLVTGASTNCVLVSGSSAACGSGGGGSGPGGNGAAISGTLASNVSGVNALAFNAVTKDTGGYTSGGYSTGLTVPTGQSGWYTVCVRLQATSSSFPADLALVLTNVISLPLSSATPNGNQNVPVFGGCDNAYVSAGTTITANMSSYTAAGYGFNYTMSAVWIGQ